MAKRSAPRPVIAPRRPLERRDAILLIAGVVDPGRPSGLCESARVVLADAETDLVVCDVSAIAGPDLGTVDALARLVLVAGHLGGHVLLLDATPELHELLGLAGLTDVLPCVEGSGLDPSG